MSKLHINQIPVQEVLPDNMLDVMVARYQTKQMTMQEIKSFVGDKIKKVYNALYDNVDTTLKAEGYMGLTADFIVPRELFEGCVAQLASVNNYTYKSVDYLKRIDVIGVCGAGYIFEEPKFK